MPCRGRVYFSQNYICFYSNIFGFKHKEKIPISEIVNVEKSLETLMNPGIVIKTKFIQEYRFASFPQDRDKIYSFIMQLWNKEDVVSKPLTITYKQEEEQEEGSQSEESEEDYLTSVVSEATHPGESILQTKGSMEQIFSCELPVTAVNVFQLLYSDQANDFQKNFHQLSEHKDFTIEKWGYHPEYGNYRTISHVAPVKHSIGPKETRVEIAQKYHLQKDSLVVESCTSLIDIPFADYFTVEARHTAVNIGDGKCQYTVKVAVPFTKKTLFAGKIKEATLRDLREHVENLWIPSIWRQIQKKQQQKKRLSITRSDKDLHPTVSEPVTRVPDKLESSHTHAHTTSHNIRTESPHHQPGHHSVSSTDMELLRYSVFALAAVVLLLLLLVCYLWYKMNGLSSQMSAVDDNQQFIRGLLEGLRFSDPNLHRKA